MKPGNNKIPPGVTETLNGLKDSQDHEVFPNCKRRNDPMHIHDISCQ